MIGWIMILWVAAVLQPSTARPVQLIFVEPAGEVFTTEEQEQARVSVEQAIAWWGDLSPTPIAMAITGTELLTTTDDVYHGWGWARPFLADDNPVTTIFVIDNSISGRLIFDDSAGETQDYYNMIAIVLYPNSDPDAMTAATAHEFGHLLYDLPHQQGATDIMNNWLTAYKMRFIGCESLEILGAPCTRVSLPLVLR